MAKEGKTPRVERASKSDLRKALARREKLKREIADRQEKIDDINYALELQVRRKKDRTAIMVGSMKVALITPQTYQWNIIKVKTLINKLSFDRKFYKKLGQDEGYALLENIVQTTESVDRSLIEELLKREIITSEQAQSLYELKPSKSFIRVDEVKDSPDD